MSPSNFDEEPPYWFIQYAKNEHEKFENFEEIVNSNSKKLEKLESRVNMLFAGLAVILTLINLVAPIVDTYLTFLKVHP